MQRLAHLGRLRLRLPRRLFSSSSDAAPPAAPPAVPKSERDRVFLAAMQVFYRLEGHFTVPGDFVVPSLPADGDAATFPWPKKTWGLPLGNRLRLFTRGRCSPFKCALLRTIGFPYADWRSYVWEVQIIPALEVFQRLEGHLFVRQPFQVPVGDERWPRATWGVKLGTQCQFLRRDVGDGLAAERKAQLDAMGFVYSDAQWKWKMQFLVTLKTYRELYGHCDVHHSFKIPSEDPHWPEVSWDYRLGSAVAKLKANSEERPLTPRSRADLRELDFYEEGLAMDVWREALMPSLELYPSLHHDDVFIPVDFVVPSEAPWPERAWGMKLGYIVQTINSKRIFRQEMNHDKPRLKELGYSWQSLYGKWAKEFLPALRLYKTKYEHCDVPSWWVVPSTDTSWPKALRGYQLGKQVVRLRRGGRDSADVSDVLVELEALGFKFNAFESSFVDRVLPALEVYAKIYGDTHVPQGFIVPSESTWPRPSWGTKLGHTVRNIRNRHQHAQQVELYRERLEKIGFVWSIYKSQSAIKRDIVEPCVEIYVKIYGEDAEIPRHFVVPADDPRWPAVARSFELGSWLFQYNRRSSGLLPIQTPEGKKKALEKQKTQHRSGDKVNLSTHAEAYWKDVLLASFQAYANVHGSCEDMDSSFLVPTEEPYPQSAWGLNLGLRLRHVRHGVRYTKEVAKYRDELFKLGVVLDLDDPCAELTADGYNGDSNENEDDYEKDGYDEDAYDEDDIDEDDSEEENFDDDEEDDDKADSD